MAIQKTLKRTLTEVERAKIRKHFQTFMPYLSKILNNDKINNETKAIVKKMHKSMKDALDYSNRLNYLK